MTACPDLALLLLHALPLDGRMWTKQLGIIQNQTFAPDLYRFGDNIQDWAASCLELVPQERLVVVGCSVGGSCALEIMRLAPHRVAATVLIGTKARHDPNPSAFAQARRTVENHGIAEAWEHYWKPLFEQGEHSAAARIAKEIALSQPAQALVDGLKSFHTRKSREDVVEQSTAPVQIVTGDQDTLPGVAYSQRLAGLSENAQLHVIENCGHYVPIMQPTKLNRLIKDTIRVANTGG